MIVYLIVLAFMIVLEKLVIEHVNALLFMVGLENPVEKEHLFSFTTDGPLVFYLFGLY